MAAPKKMPMEKPAMKPSEMPSHMMNVEDMSPMMQKKQQGGSGQSGNNQKGKK